jgi:peptidoglycan/xylan/chitin deacetylase (PgdA/CDA1 family)
VPQAAAPDAPLAHTAASTSSTNNAKANNANTMDDKNTTVSVLGGRNLNTRLRVSGPYIALAYDDGPLPESVPILLAALAKNKMRATFCVTGQNAEKDPELLKQIVAAGHEIANHSWSHPDLTKLSAKQVHEELAKADVAIKTATGHSPKYFRPPFGAVNDALIAQVHKEFGYDILMWSLDSHDWQNPPAGEVTKRILDNVKNGDILLVHESFAQSVKEMPSILSRLAAKGFKSVTVSELVAKETK